MVKTVRVIHLAASEPTRKEKYMHLAIGILSFLSPLLGGFFYGQWIVTLSESEFIILLLGLCGTIAAMALALKITDKCQEIFDNQYYLDCWALYVFLAFGFTAVIGTIRGLALMVFHHL